MLLVVTCILKCRQFGLVVMLANTLRGKREHFILTCELIKLNHAEDVLTQVCKDTNFVLEK